MKKLLTAALLALGVPAFAQTNSLSGLGCATVTSDAEIQDVYKWVETYTNAASKTNGIVDTIPLSIHIVGEDNGSGYYKLDNLFQVLCKLNTHYAPTEFYFTVKWPIRYINSSSYYVHTSQAGFQMMSQYKIAGTANVFFVKDPAGACGYYSPGADCIAIRNDCADPNSTTLTHELGHYFSLPHTFYGWENGNTPANPEKVTRGVGANCSTAGDGFCDTEADYQSQRWNCPYSGNQLDQTGTPYKPDSSIYMGYASDNCMTRFSAMEMARMQSRYDQRASALPMAGISAYSALSTPVLVYPTPVMYANEQRIIWNAVPGADYYQVRITATLSNNLLYQEALVTGTQLYLNFNPTLGATYAVRIAPLNSRNLCRAKTLVTTFTTSGDNINGLSVNNTVNEDAQVNVSPNPVKQGGTIRVQVTEAVKGNIEVVNMAGQIVSSVSGPTAAGTASVQIGQWPAGMYIVRFATASGTVRRKLTIE